MTTTPDAPARKPHSAEYFGDSRDYWWNRDFLELLARRWDTRDVRAVLDVGCGVGHWGQLLSAVLPAEARVIGVDREAAWVAQATARAAERGLGARYSYQRGDATELPFADGTFDMVTCQTVLIHLRDPRAALREMVRVLRPGGLLAVSEPNNMANAVALSSDAINDTVDEVISGLRFQLMCERGKAALGEGDNSVGPQVPGFFADCGLRDVQVYISDKASMLQPPYATPEEQATVRELLDWAGREFFVWDRHDTRRFFLAGGGTEAEFETEWARAGRGIARQASALRAGTVRFAGGGATYVVSGRKPR